MKRTSLSVSFILCALAMVAWPAHGQAGVGGGGRGGSTFGGGEGFGGGGGLFDTAREAELVKVRREQAEKALAVAQRDFEDHHSLLQSVRDQLLKVTGRVDVSADAIRKSAARVEEELESLQLDAVGAEARLAAIEKTMAEVA